MTAIAGFWGFGGRYPARQHCRAMLIALASYGRDAQDDAELGGFGLGRNLERLVPEDDFDCQPLIGAAGKLALVADIRLDNRDELQAALGIKQAEGSLLADSDLLLLAWERWSDGALARLIGDFAFAAFDSAAGTLTLARSPTGQRPLFWSRGDGFVAYASMPKGLHAIPSLRRRPDVASASRLLAQLPLAGPASYYAGLERVEPGHVVTLTRTGVARRRFWTLERQQLGFTSFEQYIEAYRAELNRSVSARLRGGGSDVAAHLSGGWDSSAVTATAARMLPAGATLHAYTTVPRDAVEAAVPKTRFADESRHAAATAALYPNIRHVMVETPLHSIVSQLDQHLALFDRPLVNLCNHAWLSEIRSAARDAGARVLLTGEIGNWSISAAPATLLADYLRAGRLREWWHEARMATEIGMARWRGVLANSYAPWIPHRVWSRLQRFSGAPQLRDQSLLRPAIWDATMADEAARFGSAVWRPKEQFSDRRDGIYGIDFGELRKGVLAGWRIDKRDATADSRLIKFCLSLPIDLLLKNGERRPLARAALADRLPAAVLEETRKGTQAADWHVALERDLSDVKHLAERIAANAVAAELIDTDALRRLISDWPQAGWERSELMGRYRNGLMQTLSTGHFIVSVTEGEQ